MDSALGSKLYYSISEVAALTQLPPYTLRAWEKEFSCLRPKRVRGKNRAYRERDIGIVLLIKHLLYEQHYTSHGVRQRLRAEPELVRQATADAGSILDPGARERVVGRAPVGLRVAEGGRRAVGSSDPTGPALPPESDVGPGNAAVRRQDVQDLLRLLRQELREVLRLC